MIYNGDYLDNKIYGTTVNNKIKVTTEDEANFILCEITVAYNGINWTHPFEVPFFNDNAELYFENYIHSIIIQNLKEFTLPKHEISLTSFDVASVQIVLKEMKQSELLEELELNFYMSLGNFDALDYTTIQNGERLLLSTNNSNFVTAQAIVSFSFFSIDTPDKLIINTYNSSLEYPLPIAPPNMLLHTIFIPIELARDLNNNLFNLSLGFSDNSIIKCKEFTLTYPGPDHSTIVYQNDFGTLTVIEFTGQKITPEEFKIINSETIINNFSNNRTTTIENNDLKYLNTGQILDESKYRMLSELISSYNIFDASDEIQKLTIKGNTKINPYVTNRSFSNETLIFKVSKNAYIHYRGF